MIKVPVGWTHMMKKDTNTMTLNLEVKSNLAKLLANENITIQHNKVKTASFDVKNRVLTLPLFKQKSGDVYDMLIAHECAHALWTPYEEWQGIDNDELRSYVNVLEDCRIDLLIQAKYPGVVTNYKNGFDILEKQNFFGISGRDINKEFMIIDKINLRSKSLKRLPFKWSKDDMSWLIKVDALVTFDDVLVLAKEMLDWQKEQVEQMKKLPDFDNHVLAKSYGLDDDDFDDEDDFDNDENGYGNSSDAEQNDDLDDEKNDFNNFGDQKADDEKDSNKSGSGSDSNSDKVEETKDKEKANAYAKGRGGDGFIEKPLKAITDEAYTQKQEELQDKKAKGYRYGKIPTPNLDKLSCLTSWKTFLKDMEAYKLKALREFGTTKGYLKWLDNSYKNFTKENKKTVMYLVKEFEMKKAATAYKRASTDKTGIIDPLKLPSYQYNEDIFKKLTIIPDGKNHGMMMLLDWSGSMSDVLMNTVKQLINLVEFCRKVNIPFEVYFFTSGRGYHEVERKGWSTNVGEYQMDNFNLVNCISHRMNKKQSDLAMKTMYHMAHYFNDRYTNSRYMSKYNNPDDYDYSQHDSYGIPSQYYLGNTPLNESLIYINKLIPMFTKKYGIEKLTFITLTDGAGNYCRGKIIGGEDPYSDEEYNKTNVYQIGKSKFTNDYGRDMTVNLLDHIKKTHKCNVIGFYVVKRIRKWDLEQYIEYKDWNDKEIKYAKMRKEMTKDKAVAVNHKGYDKFFILDGKRLGVENFEMNDVEVKKGTPSEFKRIFGKSMANRLVSRVVLNKFIKEVA